MRFAAKQLHTAAVGEGTLTAPRQSRAQPQKVRKEFSAAHRFHSCADMLY